MDVEVKSLALAPASTFSKEQVLNAFVEWMQLEVGDGYASEATVRSYLSDVRQHLDWLIANGLAPAAVTRDDLRRYRSWLISRLQVSTAARKLASVRRFYGLAQMQGFMPTNPCAGLRPPRDRTDRSERVKYLTADAMRSLLLAPAQDPKGARDRAMLMLMAMHGLRVCEIAGAQLADLDLSPAEGGVLRVLGKGRKWRSVLLTPPTRAGMEAWLRARQGLGTNAQALFVNMHWNHAAGRGHVDSGQQLTTRGIRQMVDGYLTQIGAKRQGVSCHALRHSYATLSLAAGAELVAISQSMGHASITTTLVYAKIVDKAAKNPANFLAGLLK